MRRIRDSAVTRPRHQAPTTRRTLILRATASLGPSATLGHAKLSTTDRYVSARYSEGFFERMDEAFTPVEPSKMSRPSVAD